MIRFGSLALVEHHPWLRQGVAIARRAHFPGYLVGCKLERDRHGNWMSHNSFMVGPPPLGQFLTLLSFAQSSNGTAVRMWDLKCCWLHEYLVPLLFH
jgi:hypothetical protein